MNKTLISAHRGGFEGDTSIENSPIAIARSIALGVDYIEVDVQRTLDGEFVISHDEIVHCPEPIQISAHTMKDLDREGANLLKLTEALSMMKGKVGAHIDVKFTSPNTNADWEESLVRLVVEILGTSGFILTSLEDNSILRMRKFLKSINAPEVLVGLSLGRDVTGLKTKDRILTRKSELWPNKRLKDCDANLVVANYKLARMTVLAWAKKQSMPTLIWTVDEPEDLRLFLNDERVWMVTTNYPRSALEMRSN